MRDPLRRALGLRKVGQWTARYRLATVAWPSEPLDPFFNANTVDDLAEAERLATIVHEPSRTRRNRRRPSFGGLWRGGDPEPSPHPSAP